MNQPPLLVLGCHRSGTSAVTGLLHHGADLHLGEVLPATRANPKGYYESPAVVSAHRMILARLGRDWTCPPAGFEPTDGDISAVRAALEPLLGHGTIWGAKDPRLLFMLPAWVPILDGVRFVGVVRDPGAIMKSIATRDEIPSEAASQIVSAYVKRLADIHRRLPFPVINFDAEPDEIIRRAEQVASSIGLSWDAQAARRFLSPSLVHHVAGLSADPNHHYLLEAARMPIEDVPVYDMEAVSKALSDPDLSPSEPLAQTYGPRYLERRRAVLRKVLPDADEIEALLELVPADSNSAPLMEGRFASQTTIGIPAGSTSIQGHLLDVIPPSHVVATGLIEDRSEGEIANLLADIDLRSRTRSRLILETPPASIEAVKKAMQDTSWDMGEIDDREPDRAILTLFKRFDLHRSPQGDTDPRMVLLSFDARLSAIERERAETRERRSRQSAARDADRLHELESENEKLRKQLEKLNKKYERLANRRSVRWSLRIAEFFEPLFRWRRG